MEERYFLFKKSNECNGIDFVGPLFSDEIEDCKKEEFEDGDILEVMDEKMFRLLYSKEYYSDFKSNWSEYIETLIEALGFEFGVTYFASKSEDSEEYEIDKNVIDIYDIGQIYKDKDTLNFLIDIEANARFASIITKELMSYCDGIFDINIDEIEYWSIKGEEFSGSEAIEKYYYEKLLFTDLN